MTSYLKMMSVQDDAVCVSWFLKKSIIKVYVIAGFSIEKIHLQKVLSDNSPRDWWYFSLKISRKTKHFVGER